MSQLGEAFERMRQEFNHWCSKTFGMPYLMSKEERIMRFFEEACELAQSCDLNLMEAQAILLSVYKKPKELELWKELGGSFCTWLGVCTAFGVPPEDAYTQERDRRWDKIDLIRQKHAAKDHRVYLEGDTYDAPGKYPPTGR